MIPKKFRVGVDWDGDGFINWGIPLGMPPNLVPNPYFVFRSSVYGTNISGHELPVNLPEVTKEVSENGVQTAKIACGGTNSKQVWIGYRRLRKSEPVPNDILASAGTSVGRISMAWDISGSARIVKETNPYTEYVYERFSRVPVHPDSLKPYGNDMLTMIGFDGEQNVTPVGGISDPYVKGFDVTAGSNYRLTVYHRVKDLVSAAVDYRVTLGVYHTTLTAGAYTLLASANETLTLAGGWVKTTLTFTAPVNVAHVFLKIETQAATTVPSRYIHQLAGASIYPVASNPDYVADPSIILDDSNFYTGALEASTTYNYSFYVKADDFTKVGVIVNTVDVGTSTWVQALSEQQTNISGSWIRVNVSFTTGSNSCYAMLRVIPYVGVNPAAVGVTGNLYIRGVQLTEGAQLYPFHAGVTNEYDDVTNYVTQLSWKAGKQSIEEAMPYEGNMTLTLNNDSRLFSPKNVDSPLNGYMIQNRKVLLQIQNKDTLAWDTFWAGWLSSFGAVAGRSSSREATIVCEQGVERIREGDFNLKVAQDQTFKQIVTSVISASGWRSTALAYEGVLDYNRTLNENAYIVDTDEMFNAFDDGLNTYELQGLDWGKNTGASQALEDVLMAENANMWIDREGLINIRNRHYWLSPSQNTYVTIGADTEVQKADYSYGDELINSAEVSYQPPVFTEDVEVWATKTSFLVGANRSRNIRMIFTFPEGRIKTVNNVQEAVTYTAYEVSPEKHPNAAAISDNTILEKLGIRVYENGNKYYLQLQNRTDQPLFIKASVNGDFVNTGDEVVGSYVDRDSVINNIGTYKKSISNPVISSVEQAEGIAHFYVSRNSFPVGSFDNLKLIDDGTMVFNDFISTLKIGTIVKITETQTGENDLYAVVVEERGNVSNGVFSYEVTLDKLDQKSYFQVDTGFTEYGNMMVYAKPVGVHSGYVTETDSGVTKLHSSVADGWFYFTENPYTVRTWKFRDFPLKPQPSRPVWNWRNFLELQYYGAGTSAGFGFNNDASYSPLPNNIIPTFDIDVVPQIPVSPFTYYKVHLETEITSRYLDGTYSPNRLYPILPVGNVHIISSSFRYWVGCETWSDVSGTRTLYNRTNNTLDYGEGTDYNFYTQAISPSYPTLSTEVDKTLDHVGFVVGKRTEMLVDQGAWKGLSIIKHSDINDFPISNLKSYYLAVWLQTIEDGVAVSWTLDALNEDHEVIGSTAATVDRAGITKIEVAIPTGYDYVMARLRKTSANTEERDDTLQLHGIALTENSLASFEDAPEPTSYIYF